MNAPAFPSPSAPSRRAATPDGLGTDAPTGHAPAHRGHAPSRTRGWRPDARVVFDRYVRAVDASSPFADQSGWTDGDVIGGAAWPDRDPDHDPQDVTYSNEYPARRRRRIRMLTPSRPLVRPRDVPTPQQ